MILDCGSGRRPVYYSNVATFDVVGYDTTDVCGVGESLPFKSDLVDLLVGDLDSFGVLAGIDFGAKPAEPEPNP